MTKIRNLFDELQVLGNQVPQLQLADSQVLTALEVVRVVPDKRVVCQCVWQQRVVFAKIFFGEKHARYATRDKQGAERLIASSIATPPLLATLNLAQGDGSVLIYEAISGSQNAEQAYNHLAEKERKNLIHLLVQTVAQHHQSGIIQTDCYLKNFLIKEDKVYTLDGDGIRQYPRLSHQQMLINLSTLLSKLDVLDLEKWCASLLQSYLTVNALPILNAEKINPLIEQCRIKATSNYADKKVFRQCTDVDVTKNTNTLMAVSSAFSYLPLPKSATEVNAYLQSGNVIKDGNTCTVYLAQIDKVSVVVKRYNIKNFFHGISRALRKTRAAASWANAHRLQLLGLQTARPIALIETKRFGLNRQAYFLAEYIDAAEMGTFFKREIDTSLRANAVKEMVSLMYRLYLLKISHGDMKASNIKVLSDGRASLIDLDSMKQHKHAYLALNAHVKDIKRFMQNWKDDPSLYNAFVKVFKVVYVDHAPLVMAQILK